MNKTQDQSNLRTISGTVIHIHYEVINLQVWQLFSLTLHAFTARALWGRFYFRGLSNKFCSRWGPSGGSGAVRTMSGQYVSVQLQPNTASARMRPRLYWTHSSGEVYAKEPSCYITYPMLSADLSWSRNIMLLKKDMRNETAFVDANVLLWQKDR